MMTGRPSPLLTDELGDDLSEEIRARIKSELAPGEPLLWAGRANARRTSSVRSYLIGGIIAAILLISGGLGLALGFGAFGRFAGDSDPIVAGLIGIAIGSILAVLMMANWLGNRSERIRNAQTTYAVTDRRAIAWLPVKDSDAVEVHSFDRGRVQRIHRIEYPDGTGDVIFTCPGDVAAYNLEISPDRHGFKNIADVRRVEELLKRTLHPSDPEG